MGWLLVVVMLPITAVAAGVRLRVLAWERGCVSWHTVFYEICGKELALVQFLEKYLYFSPYIDPTKVYPYLYLYQQWAPSDFS